MFIWKSWKDMRCPTAMTKSVQAALIALAFIISYSFLHFSPRYICFQNMDIRYFPVKLWLLFCLKQFIIIIITISWLASPAERKHPQKILRFFCIVFFLWYFIPPKFLSPSLHRTHGLPLSRLSSLGNYLVKERANLSIIHSLIQSHHVKVLAVCVQRFQACDCVAQPP